MMPRSENRVLADNKVISQNQVTFRNKFGDTINYTFLGMGIANGKYYNRCLAEAKAGDKVKVLKSITAAENFINKNRGEQTIFGEAYGE